MDLICETHPEQTWPHGDCPVGMPHSQQRHALVWQREDWKAKALQLHAALKALRAWSASEYQNDAEIDAQADAALASLDPDPS